MLPIFHGASSFSNILCQYYSKSLAAARVTPTAREVPQQQGQFPSSSSHPGSIRALEQSSSPSLPCSCHGTLTSPHALRICQRSECLALIVPWHPWREEADSIPNVSCCQHRCEHISSDVRKAKFFAACPSVHCKATAFPGRTSALRYIRSNYRLQLLLLPSSLAQCCSLLREHFVLENTFRTIKIQADIPAPCLAAGQSLALSAQQQRLPRASPHATASPASLGSASSTGLAFSMYRFDWDRC